VKIIIKNCQKKIPVYPKRIKEIILKVLTQEGRKNPGQLTVCFVNDKKIRELNLKYLRKNAPTDVLSFNLGESRKKAPISADIVVSTDTTVKNAKIFKTSVPQELKLYVIHGLLHLLGYADHTPGEKILMRKKEDRYVHM
jgi:probable rRNA maturation factor